MSQGLDRYTIILMGCGQMGAAIVRGLKRAGALKPGQLVCVDADVARQGELAEELGAREGLHEIVQEEGSHRLFLIAVKPQHVQSVLGSLITTEQDMIVSVAAGISLELLRSWVGHSASLVRTMPNTPCLIGAGVTGVMADVGADVRAVHELFSCVGEVVSLKDEHHFDALTAVSGSGPAYVFTMIEALADGGVLAGLDRATAIKLAAATVEGAAKLARQSGEHTAQLKDRVASPQGTTIRALATLERLGFRHALISAVEAAAQRSAEMTAQMLERLRR